MFFIFVKGGQSPSVPHATLVEAQRERDRLATMSGTLNKEIYICEVVEAHKVLPSLVEIEKEVSSV